MEHHTFAQRRMELRKIILRGNDMRKALVVGINDYPNCPLYGCVNDARSVAEILGNHEDGKKNFDVNLKENIARKGELLGLVDSLFKGNSEVALLIKLPIKTATSVSAIPLSDIHFTKEST